MGVAPASISSISLDTSEWDYNNFNLYLNSVEKSEHHIDHDHHEAEHNHEPVKASSTLGLRHIFEMKSSWENEDNGSHRNRCNNTQYVI